MMKASQELKEKFRITFVTLVASAFGFVAALSWNDAIKSTLDAFLPKEKVLIYKFVSAIIITIIAVLVIFFINKSLKNKQ